MIRFSCPSCNKQLKAELTSAGKLIKCPACGFKFAAPTAEQPSSQQESPDTSKAPHILVVDDSAVDRRLAEGICRKQLPDSLISFASDGSEALQFCEHTPVDLVVTDMQMPQLDGLELVRRLQESHAELPVVLMTAHGSEELATEALHLGAASYVAKRNLAKLLPKTIQRLLSLRASNDRKHPVRFFSCFISHSHEDQDLCERLCEALAARSIQVWFSPKHIRAGRPIHEQVRAAIYSYDKLLVVLSPHSMTSQWVMTEILAARKRESQTGNRVLFPIRLVPMEDLQEWSLFDSDTGMDIARELRQYYIPDFRSSFEEQCQKLIEDLKQDDP